MAKPATGKTTTTVQRLAQWVCGLGVDAVSEAEIAQAKLLVLDTIGCGFGGWDEKSASGVAAVIEAQGGAPHCQVIGAPWKTSVANATLVNGALCRVLDLNDYVLNSDGNEVMLGGHPSDSIAIALAFAEQAHRTGRDLLASIVIGYEIFGRARHFGGDAGEWDGVSYTGIVAPSIAGRLIKLDPERLSHALALSVARCATSAMVRTGDLSAAKSIANAMVARTGADAVLLAERGLTGPLDVIDHKRGMRSLFGDEAGLVALTVPKSDDSYIMQASIKPYPSVATSQAAVAAGIELNRKLGSKAADIERVRVVMADYPTIKRHLGDKERANPTSKEAADHSVPFLVAVSILEGAVGHAQFVDERWNKPDVRRLMGPMELDTEADIGKRAPGSFPCRLEAFDKAGNKNVAEVLYPPGFSRGGINEAEVVEKFHRTTSDIISAPDRDRIISAVMGLPKAADVSTLSLAIAAKRHERH
jgi:2-methylcitrate dehydratase